MPRGDRVREIDRKPGKDKAGGKGSDRPRGDQGKKDKPSGHTKEKQQRHEGAPVSGRITSDYGRRKDPMTGKPGFHQGMDIAAKSGTPVRCTGAGKVTRVGWEDQKDHSKGYGLRVWVDHGNGNSTRYGHLKETLVKVGETVRKGQALGKVGSTGKSTGPHVHYEERHKGRPHRPTFDPRSYRPNKGK